MNEKEFIDYTKEIGIEITTKQLEQLSLYADFLLEYNKHTNLTAIKTIEEVYLKHFYDSLTLMKITDFKANNKLLDIGSGAGFPGLILAICYPELNIDLLDSNHKKIDFLNQMIEKLQLKNVKTIYERSEEYVQKNRNKYDYITARAVAELRILVEISLPSLKIGGYFLAMKGNLEEELNNATDAIELLNGQIVSKIEFELPNSSGKRTILKIEKQKESPHIYPRSYNMIVKKALKKNNN